MAKSMPLSAIKAMKAMSEDPKKRSALIQDATCIGGLVMMLSNPDPEIVSYTLQTLLTLAEVDQYRPILKNTLGLYPQLEGLVNNKSCSSENHQSATQLLAFLNEPDFAAMTTPLKDTKNSYNSGNHSITAKPMSTKHVKARTTILQLRGMVDKHDRELVTRLLLQVKGVISITMDLKNRRCHVRSRIETKPEQLVLAIAKSFTMSAQHVTKDETGHEMLVSFSSADAEADKENSELPSYLPDNIDDSPVADARTVARPGLKEKGSGWLNSAANFLSKSFYW